MSKQFHKSYRSILQKYTGTIEGVPYTAILWCLVDSQTSRTIRTSHLAVTAYIDRKFKGVSANFAKQNISIAKPLAKIDAHTIDRLISRASNEAYKDWMVAKSKSGLTGTVLYFDANRGEGAVQCNELPHTFQIHACNFIGKKTWYPETACMYAERGAKITFTLADMGTHVIANDIAGETKFDASKWASLPQDKLAFKCDDSGKAINGLFE